MSNKNNYENNFLGSIVSRTLDRRQQQQQQHGAIKPAITPDVIPGRYSPVSNTMANTNDISYSLLPSSPESNGNDVYGLENNRLPNAHYDQGRKNKRNSDVDMIDVRQADSDYQDYDNKNIKNSSNPKNLGSSTSDKNHGQDSPYRKGKILDANNFLSNNSNNNNNNNSKNNASFEDEFNPINNDAENNSNFKKHFDSSNSPNNVFDASNNLASKTLSFYLREKSNRGSFNSNKTTVHISIGRIDIRAIMPEKASTGLTTSSNGGDGKRSISSTSKPSLSLSDYLRQRSRSNG